MSPGFAPAPVSYPYASRVISPHQKTWNAVREAVEYINSKAVHQPVIGLMGGITAVATAVYTSVSVAAAVTVQYALSSVCAIVAGTTYVTQAVMNTIYAILCRLID